MREKSDRRPEENKSLDFESDNPLADLTQNAVGAGGAFDIAAKIAPRKFGLYDIQSAVFDLEVEDSDENAGCDSRQKSDQRDDPGDHEDKDVVAAT